MKNFLKIAGLFILVGILFILADLADSYLSPTVQWIIILLLISACVYAFPKYRKMRIIREMQSHPSEQPPVTLAPLKDTILYLRPFKTDNQQIEAMEYGGKKYYTIESLICSEIAKKGLPIAIGKPREKLKPIGANRYYIDNDYWQDSVIRFLEQSDYAILYVDFTPGIKWEIETSLSLYKEKLILIPKIFNRNAGYLKYFLLSGTLESLLGVGIYKILTNNHRFSYLRRGFSYYQNWAQVFGDVMNCQELNDEVSAVFFENGNPIFCKAKNGTLEAQLDAILDAIKIKQGLQTIDNMATLPDDHHNILKEPFSVSCYANLKNGTNRLFPLSWIQRDNSCLALGELVFLHSGFSWVTYIFPLLPRKRVIRNLTSIATFSYKEGIPYADIERVELISAYCLKLITKKVQGTYYITFPKYQGKAVSAIQEYLNQCISAGCAVKNDAAISSIQNAADRQIASSNLLTILFLLLSLVLFFFDMYLGLISILIAILCTLGRKGSSWLTFLIFMVEIFLLVD